MSWSLWKGSQIPANNYFKDVNIWAASVLFTSIENLQLEIMVCNFEMIQTEYDRFLRTNSY